MQQVRSARTLGVSRMSDEVIGTISASMGRRVLGIASLALLGFLLIYVSFTQPPAILGQVFLLATGSASLWIADKMRRATATVIELTASELRDSSGELICTLDDIESIDRGFFAFKPSNGFLLMTQKPRHTQLASGALVAFRTPYRDWWYDAGTTNKICVRNHCCHTRTARSLIAFIPSIPVAHSVGE